MLKISRGVEHDPEAEPLVESSKKFDLKNRFLPSLELLDQSLRLKRAVRSLRVGTFWIFNVRNKIGSL